MREMTAAKRGQSPGLGLGELVAGRYAVHELLGSGGMGAVYRADDRALGEEIALKVLLLDDPREAASFRDEVRLARRVSHPNVARVHDVGEHRGMLYLTMELVDGGTLRSLLAVEGRLDARRAVAIARGICAGLSAAHAAGIVHRDLKPSNVLLDRTGRVVLADFGVAASFAEAPPRIRVAGTPGYMAPEVLAGLPSDGRADLFALGVLLFVALGGGDADAAARGARGPLEARGVPGSLIAVIERCLAPDPDARPPSADEVARLLDLALSIADADTMREGRASIAEIPASTLPAVPARRALAVLPFRYAGPAELDYLGDAVAEELVDALVRARGLRVLGTGRTARFRADRDPIAAGRALGAFALVDGAVQIAAGRAQITARLVDAESGAQIVSDRHEGAIGDLFELQRSAAICVAEHLRVELDARAEGRAPAEAVERYFAARRSLRAFDYAGCSAAYAGFSRCLELSPGYAPALAGRAVAALRSFFFSPGEGAPDWEKIAAESVAAALEGAADLAETHLADGMRAVQRGDYAAAVRSLGRSLVIAPACADTNEFLGTLQCEAGLSHEGIARLRFADAIDPTLTLSLLYIARDHALRGRPAAAVAALEELERRRGFGVPAFSMAIRTAAWRGDRDAVRRAVSDPRAPATRGTQGILLYGRAFLGEIDGDALDRAFARILSGAESPRRATLIMQQLTEAHALAGRVAPACLHLLRAATGTLVDADWLDHCPALASLRGRPELAEARRRVTARARALWAR
jgi:serine/threonine-protein kinase